MAQLLTPSVGHAVASPSAAAANNSVYGTRSNVSAGAVKLAANSMALDGDIHYAPSSPSPTIAISSDAEEAVRSATFA